MKSKWLVIGLIAVIVVLLGVAGYLGVSLLNERKNVATVEAQAQTDQPEVKKSTSGICHDKSSRYYAATKNYEAFESIDECLSSGGRLPY